MQEQSSEIARRTWVWHSTPQSFSERRVSVLALAETIAAAAVTLHGTFSSSTGWLTLAAIAAPFLLLRTPESVAYALEKFPLDFLNDLPSSIEDSATRTDQRHSARAYSSAFSSLLLSLLGVAVFAATTVVVLLIATESLGRTDRSLWQVVVGTAFALALAGVFLYNLWNPLITPLWLRLYSTIRATVSHPLYALGSVPTNWWNQIACIDIIYPPELLPGAILRDCSRNRVSSLQPFGFFLRCARGKEQLADPTLPLIAATLTYIYRWSIKGTAVLLLPLVWLVYDARTIKPEYIGKSTLFKWLFAASCAVFIVSLGVMASRVVGTDFGLSEPLTKLLASDSSGILAQAFPSGTIAPWQLALLIVAILTITTFLTAERLGSRGYDEKALVVLRTLMGALGIAAVVLIFCLIYFSASLALA